MRARRATQPLRDRSTAAVLHNIRPSSTAPGGVVRSASTSRARGGGADVKIPAKHARGVDARWAQRQCGNVPDCLCGTRSEGVVGPRGEGPLAGPLCWPPTGRSCRSGRSWSGCVAAGLQGISRLRHAHHANYAGGSRLKQHVDRLLGRLQLVARGRSFVLLVAAATALAGCRLLGPPAPSFAACLLSDVGSEQPDLPATNAVTLTTTRFPRVELHQGQRIDVTLVPPFTGATAIAACDGSVLKRIRFTLGSSSFRASRPGATPVYAYVLGKDRQRHLVRAFLIVATQPFSIPGRLRRRRASARIVRSRQRPAPAGPAGC